MKWTPQLAVALAAIIIVGGLGIAGTITGQETLSAIGSLVGGFGLGAYHEAGGSSGS